MSKNSCVTQISGERLHVEYLDNGGCFKQFNHPFHVLPAGKSPGEAWQPQIDYRPFLKIH